MATTHTHALLLVFLLSLFGCVDINTSNISTKDYRSQVRFAHLALPTVGAASIQIDSEPYGNINFSETGLYKDIPSGFRKVTILYGFSSDTLITSLETDRKMTVFITGDSTQRQYLIAVERFIFESGGLPDAALLRMVHASPDVAGVLVTGQMNSSTSILASGLTYRQASTYSKLNAATYTLNIISGTDTLFKNLSYQFDANKRYTLAVYGLRANVQQKRFQDD